VIDVFQERGEQLALSRKLLADDAEYTAALALVSIHAAIAFNDALLVKLTGSHSASADHMEAVRRTKRQCSSQQIHGNGPRHLELLIKAKTRVSYSKEETSPEAAATLALASERFETWVRPLLQ
jgi:hypothetical protein